MRVVTSSRAKVNLTLLLLALCSLDSSYPLIYITHILLHLSVYVTILIIIFIGVARGLSVGGAPEGAHF